MSILKRIKSRITMVKTGYKFYDIVSKCIIYEYIDCYLNKYYAESKFGHRVKVK